MSELYRYTKIVVYVYSKCNKSLFKTGKNRAYISKSSNHIKLIIPSINKTFDLLTGLTNTLTKDTMKLETDKKGNDYIKFTQAREKTTQPFKDRPICEFLIYPCTRNISDRLICLLKVTAKEIYNKLLIMSGREKDIIPIHSPTSSVSITGGYRNKTKRNKTKRNKTKRNKTKRNKSKRNKSKTKRNRTKK